MHLLEPDEDSKAVAHHLLRAPARGQWGLRFRFELCRRFLGHELADALGAQLSLPHFTRFTSTSVQMGAPLPLRALPALPRPRVG
jgi:hypothetical protein